MLDGISRLVRQASEGDQRAFSELIARCKYVVYGVCLSALRDFDLAEDVAQESFIKAYHNLPKLRDGKSFVNWLRIIATNECRLHLRRHPLRDSRVTDQDVPLEPPADTLPPDIQATQATGEEEQDTLERAALRAMDRLPEDTRQMVTMYYMGGHSLKEIGQFFGVTEQAMKMRLHRARKTLRKEALSMVEETLTRRGLDPGFKDRISVSKVRFLFTDISGFAVVTKQLPAEQWIDVLYEHLSEMTDVLLKYGGTLDRYDGDSIMSFFGAPEVYDDHAVKACLTALDMQSRMAELRARWREEGKPELKLKIGLNTGDAIVGSMGSRHREEYTAIGDEVNLASRLEQKNGDFDTEILISQSTYEASKASVIVREVGTVRSAHDNDEQVAVYELLSRRGELPDEKARTVAMFEEGYAAYQSGSWEEALVLFRRAVEIDGNDGPSLAYIERCEYQLFWIPMDEQDSVKDTPVVKYVNLLLLFAVENGAKTISLNPGPEKTSIEMDSGEGSHHLRWLSNLVFPAVLDRFKRLASLDKAIQDREQTGTAEMVSRGDLRSIVSENMKKWRRTLEVSTIPGDFGERIEIHLGPKT